MKNFILFTLLSALLSSQSAENPVSISARVDSPARAGEVIEVKIRAEMDQEWHIYSIYDVSDGPLPTEISISGSAVGTVAPVREPEPLYVFDPGFETDTYYHEGDTEFIFPLRLKRSVQPGTHSIVVEVFYMVCNARLCYPPLTQTETVQVVVEEGEPRSNRATFNIASTKNDDGNTEDGDRTLLSILLLAIGGAMLSWVMPCVYPMLPIIISFFGKMSEDKNIGRNTIATFYGLGIAGTFVLIGLVVGFLSWGVNDVATQSKYANIGNLIATDPWINLGLGVLFIFFALWMFGIVNVNIAGGLVNTTDKAGQSANSAYIGSFLLGVAFAITSFSCTVPVVGTLLVVAAAGTAGSVLTSIYGMAIYGVVFAVPFVALSLFPKALDKLPNSGAWMETLKIGFGFIEIAAAIKFLWVPDLEWGLGLLPRNIVLVLFILIGLLLIGYLLGLFRVGTSENIKPFQLGKGRALSILVTVFMLYPVVMSFASAPTYHYSKMPRLMDEILEALVPPPPTEDEIAIDEGWFVDQYDEALKAAKDQKKPLFIDFTGVYCANCRVMERRVFPKRPVKEQLDKMVLTRLYVDKRDSMSQVFAQLQFERYKQATQPYYVILDPEDESTVADTGGYVPNGFAEFLSDGVSSYYERKRDE